MYDAERTDEGGIQHATYLAPHTQQLWDDTLMMTVLPLAVIGKVLDRPQYVGEAVRQALLHVKYLADPTTGLWFHGAPAKAPHARAPDDRRQDGHSLADITSPRRGGRAATAGSPSPSRTCSRR